MPRLVVVCTLLATLMLALVSTFAAGAERPAHELAPPATRIDAADAASDARAQGSGRVADLIAAGKIVVAVVSVDRYPFFYVDAKGNLAGSDIDLARGIAQELGVELMFNRSASTFDGVVDLVAKGEADIGISKLSITLPRAQRVRFTQPYIELGQGLLINRVALASAGLSHDRDIIEALNRPGRRLGAVQGTSYVGFGHSLFPEADLIEYRDKQAMFAAVLAGDVIAVLYDENEIKQYIFERPDRLIEVKVQMLPKRTDPIAIAVADPQLQYWLDTYLELKGVRLTVNELLTRYPRPEQP
ncbi:MAG: ABC transporter substrate-binding protein [Dehalococcoidia bacterium]